jgi:ferric-dicitrate binding protein FerR (iron transport regulator)
VSQVSKRKDIPARKVGLIPKMVRIAAIFTIIFLCGVFSTYYITLKFHKEIVSTIEIKAPKGARSEIVLADQTKVWLNAGSILRYKTDFNKKHRDIWLEGEAYFKVAKNPAIPFLVMASGLKIRAIGTEFNVKAYPNENIVETTLVEGKISIEEENKSKQKIYLEPNQKIVFCKNSNGITDPLIRKKIQSENLSTAIPNEDNLFVSRKFDPAPDVSWKENKLVIKSEELEQIARLFERKYNVQIVFASDEVKRFHFTGTLEDETLQQVLDVIKLTAPINYSINGKTVKLYENKIARRQFENICDIN